MQLSGTRSYRLWIIKTLPALANGGIGQAIRLGIVFTADVHDGKFQRAPQLLADPVEGIEAGTAAGILALHLPHHHFRIGKDMQRFRLEVHRVLQRFEQRGVLSHIVIMLPDPAGNLNLASIRDAST
jgi:hypothetical protein